ncbi:MAG: hypothetical protein DRP99_04520 [Candidatus Latescibacterota bacterium]|nr:MAG: hypothetical protein DRP99_04520 [Candidatus Latescibacterota bacterium]
MLKEKFGRSDGLASEGLTLLDPAAGTMAFVAEACREAAREFVGGWTCTFSVWRNSTLLLPGSMERGTGRWRRPRDRASGTSPGRRGCTSTQISISSPFLRRFGSGYQSAFRHSVY